MNFRIDTLPLTNDIAASSDYVSKLIYSATADTITIYKKEGKYCLNACESVVVSNSGLEYTFILNRNIFYYDGTPVWSEDYIRLFILLKERKVYSGFFLCNICQIIRLDRYSFKITLRKRTPYFLKVLSMYHFSPVKDNNITCGPYYVTSQDKKGVILKRNPFYRIRSKTHNEYIAYILSTNYIQDISDYNHGLIDVTNNTMFPYEDVRKYSNLVIRPNYIWVCLSFSLTFLGADYLGLRHIIYSSINRWIIADKLNKCVFPAIDFLIQSYGRSVNCNGFSKYNIMIDEKKVLKNFTRVLTFGYDPFYPNKIIAEIIKNQLGIIGLKIQLVENKYGERNENDMNLKLTYPPYIDDISFYVTPFFKTLSNVVGNKSYEKKIDDFAMEKNSITELAKDFSTYMPLIPIVKMNSIYMIREQFKIFDFVECNYYDL